MRLHGNQALFNNAIRATAQRMNIPPEFVEKDYWVTFALFSIYNNEIGIETVFKGGTALSKCFSIIERFSEEIEVNEFFKSSAFDHMLLLVAQDDRESFKNNNEWLAEHPKDALLFRDTENIWNELENTYLTDFRNLVYGNLPAGSEILQTLQLVSSRLQVINW